MNKLLAIALASTVLLALQAPAFGQSASALQRRLTAATSLSCSFSALATGAWDDDTPSVAASESSLTVSFSNVDVDEGTADTDTGFGTAFISVRYSEGYLHLLAMSQAGPLYLTTVLARTTAGGRFMAVHTRLEYSQMVIPGFTSRPEMHVGSCAIDG